MISESLVNNTEIPILVGKLQTALKRSINESLRLHDLKYPQYRLLEILSKTKKVNPSHFARELSIEGASLTRQFDSLEKMNLISRAYDTKDRRLVWVEINQEGIETALTAGQSVKACLNELFKKLDENDIETFKKICEKLAS